MSRQSFGRFSILVAALLAVIPVPVRAADDPAVQRGLQFLRTRSGSQGVGESALIALAMLKAEVPMSDPALAGCLAKVRTRFLSTGYSPERGGGPDIYEAAVVSMALANLDAETRRA